MSGQRRDCVCPRVKHLHGTHRAYQTDRCRCFVCRVAHANAARAYRNGGSWVEQLVDSTGTRRRLQALAAAGVTSRVIAERMGVSADMVIYLRGGSHRTVTLTSAAKTIDAYNALWDRPCVTSRDRACRTQALAAGYLPPLAWDDDDLDNPDALPRLGDGQQRWDLKPCGTAAAARRHYRRGEPLDAECLAAMRRDRAERRAA